MTIQIRIGTTGRKSYRVERMLDGVRVSKTFKTKAEAKQFDALMTADPSFAGTILDRTRNKLTINQAAADYLASYKGRDPSTAQRLNFWVNRFKDRQVAGITTAEVRETLNAMSSDGLADSTLNRYKVQLSALYSYLRDIHGMTANPTKDVKQRKEANAYSRFLSREEIARLLDACTESRWDRLYLLVLAAITTGARRTELITLRWSDIDFERQRALVTITKNDKPRQLKLTDEVIEELGRFRGIGDAFVFVNEAVNPFRPWVHFDQAWRDAKKAAGVEIKFHGLRHTCASWLAMEGHGVQAVANIMGHKSLAMTMRYSHLCDDFEHGAVQTTFSGVGRRAAQ
ncbi:tyrosine-type recombinase/integrase [Aeromonas caviae]|uniref:Site-specific integrase n=1 Tax=Aeromonas caviae TaxID=648 RepID=A0AAF0JYA5_AERCA|nr:site-specific integrase [Aeromonas caviae]MBL0547709.1 site-specific integrase [Aeromonas caviae]WGC85883.1 site-specific integrase [Aeromonas caviae]BBG90565.1 integrase [Aeromonas caviae]BBT54213.1 integrase [Aeromonas caviae]